MSHILGEENRQQGNVLISDIDMVVEACVRHGMTVATMASEHHRGLIVKNAQRVIEINSYQFYCDH